MIMANTNIMEKVDIGTIIKFEENKNYYICLIQKQNDEQIEPNILTEIDIDSLELNEKQKKYIEEYRSYVKWYNELEVGRYIGIIPSFFFSYHSKYRNSYIININKKSQTSYYSYGSFYRYSFINSNGAMFFKLPPFKNEKNIKKFIMSILLANNVSPIFITDYNGRYVG